MKKSNLSEVNEKRIQSRIPIQGILGMNVSDHLANLVCLKAIYSSHGDYEGIERRNSDIEYYSFMLDAFGFEDGRTMKVRDVLRIEEVTQMDDLDDVENRLYECYTPFDNGSIEFWGRR